jgi:hypothetical protein
LGRFPRFKLPVVLERLRLPFRVVTSEFLVRDPLAHALRKRDRESLAIIQLVSENVFAMVVTERLLIQVTEQVKRFHADVSTIQSALEQRPKIFESIYMNAAIHLFNRVIDNFVSVFTSHPFIREKKISVESRASLNVFFYFSLYRILATIRDL